MISVPGTGELLFSTPFDSPKGRRTSGKVFISVDSGASWTILHHIGDPADKNRGFGYSVMAPLNATHFGLVWEAFYYGSHVAPRSNRQEDRARHQILFRALPFPPAAAPAGTGREL